MGDPVTIGLMVGGTLLSAYSQMEQGAAQQKLMNYQAEQQQRIADSQAKQMEIAAGQERAQAQLKMIELGKGKRLAQSRAQALAAAGGGGSLDPSVVDIMGDLEAEGTYNQNLALYEGEERAKDLEYGAKTTRSGAAAQGAIDRYSGKMYKSAGQLGAFSTILSGAGNAANSRAGQSLLAKYG